VAVAVAVGNRGVGVGGGPAQAAKTKHPTAMNPKHTNCQSFTWKHMGLLSPQWARLSTC
jgi:hypothetical protein